MRLSNNSLPAGHKPDLIIIVALIFVLKLSNAIFFIIEAYYCYQCPALHEALSVPTIKNY